MLLRAPTVGPVADQPSGFQPIQDQAARTLTFSLEVIVTLYVITLVWLSMGPLKLGYCGRTW